MKGERIGVGLSLFDKRWSEKTSKCVKAGVHVNLSEILVSLKRG